MGLQRRGDQTDVRTVSPIYAGLGPRPGHAVGVAGSVAGGERLIKDWRGWRAEYGDAWAGGVVGTPPPPHAELFGYAV